MNNDTQTQQNIEKNSNLKDTVISRIKENGVTPKSRLVFLCSDCTVWFLWVLTVIIGAIAFSETFYVSMHSGIEMYEVTHESLFVFIVESLPYVWLVAFVGMILLGHYNMRQTRKGYRYPLWQIILSSVVFTIVGGFVLHSAGVSKAIDRMIGLSMPMYNSVEERQEYLWMHPQDGRITGVFVEKYDNPMEIFFKDVVDRPWMVAIHELPQNDIDLLLSGKRVRLVGEANMNTIPYFFHGCGVLPWIPDEGHSFTSLREKRADTKLHMSAFDNQDNLDESEMLNTNKLVATEPSFRCRKIMHDVIRAQK